ncbi:AAA family ATPase [Shewanella kaireitica]|uniref:AAA family ATPase n=1 Tax=Shewanella kaireitica TaxID=212021 RepID=UPI00200F78AC|nr:MoxR family ATPase [Shewanella kaireitica]MCL1094318.1 MoxR family ATPase [Shewanella kaireitica]
MSKLSLSDSLQQLSLALSRQVVGQQHVVDALIIALVAEGHVLLEGLPGTAKTRSVRALSNCLDASLGRVQFTPDLMPSDVIGYETLDSSETMVFKEGPVFTNILLADEINRAPPKVQSSLLEAMEERQVTVGGKTHPLPELFMVLATQNPIEQEGTYPLPEAQLDRFLMKITVDYPIREAELDILRLVKSEALQQKPNFSIEQSLLLQAREAILNVSTSDSLEQYIVDIVMTTRFPQQFKDSELKNWIQVGASPRATIALEKCARTHAFIKGKDYVDPDDVRAVVNSVLGHRLILSYDAIADGISAKDVVTEIIKRVPVA